MIWLAPKHECGGRFWPFLGRPIMRCAQCGAWENEEKAWNYLRGFISREAFDDERARGGRR